METRVLIVDDEPLARRNVAIRLEAYPSMLLVGQASSGEEAIDCIAELKPDLVFLDVQMTGMTGIEVARSLRMEPIPLVIFLTAYDEYAVAAFEVHAIDYLLKPLDDERFSCAIERVNRRLLLEHRAAYNAWVRDFVHMQVEDRSGVPLTRFAVRVGSRLSFVSASQIDWIEASGDYAGLHVGVKTHLIRHSISWLEVKLDPQQFVRVHRSRIVQVDRISRIESLSNRDCELVLGDGTVLRVSRTYSKALWELLRSFGM